MSTCTSSRSRPSNGLDDEKLLEIAESARARSPRVHLATRRSTRTILIDESRSRHGSRSATAASERARGERSPARGTPCVQQPLLAIRARHNVHRTGRHRLPLVVPRGFHWNTPATPVDFEQREGRVHRYRGHAIRKNLAEHHGDEIREVAAKGGNPWDEAYRRGIAVATDRFGELAPHWITEGTTKIERHVFPYPLSQDHDRYSQLKDDLVLYRLTFGQPRQEDMVELLRRRGVHHDPAKLEHLRLDLRPPPSA